MSEPPGRAIDVERWVEAAAANPEEYHIRRVIRLVLRAVTRSPALQSSFVIKGGVLLALRYGTNRHTKDLDFSTERLAGDIDPETICSALQDALDDVATTDEGLLCRVQSSRMNPTRADATQPTLRIRIGYAIKGDRQFPRMVQGRDSSNVVIVDVSFNEKVYVPEMLAIENHRLLAYSLHDQMAEKFRAMVQQTSGHRNRVRRQDLYDLFVVIDQGYLAADEDKAALLATMRRKFGDRDVECERDTITDPEIADRCRREYEQLADEIDGRLPDFDAALQRVTEYYRSLPWSTS